MLLFFAGAEYYNTLEFDTVSNCTASSSQKRTGGYSYYLSSSGSYWAQKNLASAKSELYIQVAFYFSNFGTGIGSIIKWKKGATVLGTLCIDGTTRVVKLYTGDTTTLVATGTKQVQMGTWYVIEVHLKIADAGGVLEARIDGIPDASFSGDTKPGADADIDGIQIINNIVAAPIYFDDVVINDTTGAQNNSWPNSARVIAIRPNGAGTTTQWTPSAGSNYQCVDETPPSLTDYVATNIDGKLDTYTLADLPADVKLIQGIRVDAFGLKTGTPAVNNLKCALRTGGTNYLSANKAVPTSLALLPEIWEQNPNTAAAWTISDINALEAGQQSAT